MSEADAAIPIKHHREKWQIAVGDRFGRLGVICEGDPVLNYRGHRVRRWRCVCDCGEQRDVRTSDLTSGKSKSCGCLQKEIVAAGRTTHGATAHRRSTGLYKIWTAMRERCENPNSKNFAFYGARGIVVCERWRNFQLFKADMGERPSSNHSIDRIDNSLGYSPSNCRWATRIEQARNKRNNRHINVRGESRVLAEIAETAGIDQSSVRLRVERGWDLDKLDAPRSRAKPRRKAHA